MKKKGPMSEKQKQHLRQVWKKKKGEPVQEEQSPFLEPTGPARKYLHMPYTVTFRTHSGETIRDKA